MSKGIVSKGAVPFSQYLSDPAVSASSLKIMQKLGPEIYYRTVVDPNRVSTPPTPAMKFGSFIHTSLLEPDQLKARYGPCGARNTKDGKATADYLISVGAEPVSKADWSVMEGMVDSVRSHVAASSLLAEGHAEQSVWWDDEASGLCCKARCDWINKDTIVDLKTTQAGGSTPEEFARTVARFDYQIQAAHYLRSGAGSRFIFLVVEKLWPYPVGLFELDEEAIALGNKQIDEGLAKIAEGFRSDSWPGHADEVSTISLPNWAFSK